MKKSPSSPSPTPFESPVPPASAPSVPAPEVFWIEPLKKSSSPSPPLFELPAELFADHQPAPTRLPWTHRPWPRQGRAAKAATEADLREKRVSAKHACWRLHDCAANCPDPALKQTALAGLADIAQSALVFLDDLARSGDQDAASRLAALACQYGEALERLRKQNLKLLRAKARMAWRWPVMLSGHKALSEDPEIVLREIELGADLTPNFWAGCKWKPDSAALVAWHLHHYLAQACDRRARDWVATEATSLPPWDKATAQSHWWPLALKVLQDQPGLMDAILQSPMLAKLVAAPSRSTVGRRRAALLEKIRQRFVGLAPK